MKKAFRLLLVEDDPDDVLLFRKHLPSTYELTAVSCADDVRPALQSSNIDVLFIDYRLGADDGLSLVRALAAEGVRQPMVMMTGGDIEALGENALLAGATDFLAKADLSSGNIERAARWSMIRRIVEVRKQATNPRFELDELLALSTAAPPAMQEATITDPLRRVMYVSRAEKALSPQQFSNLCALAAARNQSVGITGVLALVGDCFLQCVEGPDAAIQELIVRISRDGRHSDLVIISDQPINRRDFAIWNMGSFSVRRIAPQTPHSWLKRVQQVRDTAQMQGSGKDGFAAALRSLAL